jgi:hypothetical protein
MFRLEGVTGFRFSQPDKFRTELMINIQLINILLKGQKRPHSTGEEQ